MAVKRAIITRFDAGCTHNIEDTYEKLISSIACPISCMHAAGTKKHWTISKKVKKNKIFL